MAGALGVRLGGTNTYDACMRRILGTLFDLWRSPVYPRAVRVMYATSTAGLMLCLAIRWVVN